MVDTIEVEVTDAVAEMHDRLVEEHGETVVDADLSYAIQQSIRQGFMQLPDES